MSKSLTRFSAAALLAFAAAFAPVSADPSAVAAGGGLVRLNEACGTEPVDGGSGGCQKAANYICSTTRADYIGYRPI
jgi:hypothetical protein